MRGDLDEAIGGGGDEVAVVVGKMKPKDGFGMLDGGRHRFAGGYMPKLHGGVSVVGGGAGGDCFSVVTEGKGGEVVVVFKRAGVGNSGIGLPEAERRVVRATGCEKGAIGAEAADHAEGG